MVIDVGSVESIVVEVSDELGGLEALPATTFDIYDTDGVPALENQSAVVEGMRAICVIDGPTLDVGDFDLWISFASGPETPRLGPHRFRIR